MLAVGLAVGMLGTGMGVSAQTVEQPAPRSWVISPRDSWQKVRLRVVAQDGTPVAGLWVELGEQQLRTDEAGECLLSTRAGIQQVTLCNRESGQTLTKTVSVEKREGEQLLPRLIWRYETPMETVAKAGAGLAVKFVDSQMRPVSGVQVSYHFAGELRHNYRDGKTFPGAETGPNRLYTDFDTANLYRGTPGEFELAPEDRRGVTDYRGRAGLVNCPKTEYYIYALYQDSRGVEHGQRFYADLRDAQGRVDKVFCLDGATLATVVDNQTGQTVWQSSDSQSPRRVTMAYHRAVPVQWDSQEEPRYTVTIHWEDGPQKYSLWLDGNSQNKAVLMGQESRQAMEIQPDDRADLCQLLGIAQDVPPSEE